MNLVLQTLSQHWQVFIAWFDRYTVSATWVEQMAAFLFVGFSGIFLFPILIMDLLFYLPPALWHLLSGKARISILFSTLRDWFIWMLVLIGAFGLLYLVSPRSFTLLYKSAGGVAGLALGAFYLIYSLVKHAKVMRGYYYTQLLAKNLTRRQQARYDRLSEALKSGQKDPAELMQHHHLDYLERKIIEDFRTLKEQGRSLDDMQIKGIDLNFL